MIDFRESKIFKWQVTQPHERFVGRESALANFLQQLAKSALIHQATFDLLWAS